MVIRTRLLLGYPLSRWIVWKWGVWRARRIDRLIGKYLEQEYRVLDFGAGDCIISDAYRKKGYDVTPVDIEDISLVKGLDPVIFDGKQLPFEDDAFDLAMILTVLHHTSNPEEVLREAMRVSRRLVIVEDIFASRWGYRLTCFVDSLQNQEFGGHPHANKTDVEWKGLFGDFGLELVDAKYSRWVILLKQATYYLEKPRA